MGTIIQFLQDGAFDPNDIHSMSMALDDVCKELSLPGGDHPARRVIAERIIALARQGLRSPTLLRDRVLQEAGLAHAVDLRDRAARGGSILKDVG